MNGEIEKIWVIVAPFLTLAAVFYWAALKETVPPIWKSDDNFWWKCRCTIVAAFTCIWVGLKKGFKNFPVGTLVNIIIQLIKARLGFPAAAKLAKKAASRMK